MPLAQKIAQVLSEGSWIRRMFEEAIRLRRERGADRVFDFSLGNPSLEPPQEFRDALRRLVEYPIPRQHAYMPNAGLPEAREAFADSLSRESGFKLPPSNVVLTVGAAGGINIFLRAVMDPGDEIVFFAPYFAEYIYYAMNAGARPVIVPTESPRFLPDPAALAKALTPKTKVVLINYPNNPTGRNYPEALLRELASVVAGKAIYLVSDEPYKKILYRGRFVSLLGLCPNAVCIGSHSKDLGLAGERIGYLAVSPEALDAESLISASIFCQRTLGFVNAPALIQRAAAASQHALVDVGAYRRNYERLAPMLRDFGLEFEDPEGAFYIFARVPWTQDVAFVRHLQRYGILAVPGSGFGMPGHIRLSYSVDPEMIDRSAAAWRRAREELPAEPAAGSQNL